MPDPKGEMDQHSAMDVELQKQKNEDEYEHIQRQKKKDDKEKERIRKQKEDMERNINELRTPKDFADFYVRNDEDGLHGLVESLRKASEDYENEDSAADEWHVAWAKEMQEVNECSRPKKLPVSNLPEDVSPKVLLPLPDNLFYARKLETHRWICRRFVMNLCVQAWGGRRPPEDPTQAIEFFREYWRSGGKLLEVLQYIMPMDKSNCLYVLKIDSKKTDDEVTPGMHYYGDRHVRVPKMRTWISENLTDDYTKWLVSLESPIANDTDVENGIPKVRTPINRKYEWLVDTFGGDNNLGSSNEENTPLTPREENLADIKKWVEPELSPNHPVEFTPEQSTPRCCGFAILVLWLFLMVLAIPFMDAWCGQYEKECKCLDVNLTSAGINGSENATSPLNVTSNGQENTTATQMVNEQNQTTKVCKPKELDPTDQDCHKFEKVYCSIRQQVKTGSLFFSLFTNIRYAIPSFDWDGSRPGEVTPRTLGCIAISVFVTFVAGSPVRDAKNPWVQLGHSFLQLTGVLRVVYSSGFAFIDISCVIAYSYAAIKTVLDACKTWQFDVIKDVEFNHIDTLALILSVLWSWAIWHATVWSFMLKDRKGFRIWKLFTNERKALFKRGAKPEMSDWKLIFLLARCFLAVCAVAGFDLFCDRGLEKLKYFEVCVVGLWICLLVAAAWNVFVGEILVAFVRDLWTTKFNDEKKRKED